MENKDKRECGSNFSAADAGAPLPVELMAAILRDYFGEGEIKNIVRPVQGGLTNYNFRVSRPGGDYFLKIFRRAKVERVVSLIALLELLNRQNFSTPPLVKTAGGSSLWSSAGEPAQGATLAMMTKFIDGYEAPRTIDMVNRVGVLAASLHGIEAGKLLAEQRLQRGYSLHLGQLLQRIEAAQRERSARFPADLEMLLGEAEKLGAIPFHELPLSLIHGDIFSDNVLVSRHDDIYLIDFEGGCLDNPLFDLGRAVIGCSIFRGRIDPKLAGSLVQGYSLFRSLEAVEREYLFEYIVYAGLISSLWRYLEFELLRPGEKRGAIYRELADPTLAFLLGGKKRANAFLLDGI